MYDIKERFLKSKLFWIIAAAVVAVTAGIIIISSAGRIKPQLASDVRLNMVSWGYADSEDFKHADGFGVHTLFGIMNNDITLTFYQYDKNDKNARKTMEDIHERTYEMLKSSFTTTERKGSNYVFLEGYSDTNYFMYVKAGNSSLDLTGPKKYESNIKEIAGKLGYYKE